LKVKFMAGARGFPVPIAAQIQNERVLLRMPSLARAKGKLLESLSLMQNVGANKAFTAEGIAHNLNFISRGSARVVAGKDITGSVESLPFDKLPEVELVVVNIRGTKVAVVPNANRILQRNFPMEVVLLGDISSIGISLAMLN
jgi:hypothetical protein